MAGPDFNNCSMLDLFRIEVDSQGAILSEGLLALEQGQVGPERLEAMMRAAHSLKGAARLVGVEPVVRLAHAMEDVFVAAQKGEVAIASDQTDVLLRTMDTISAIAKEPDDKLPQWVAQNGEQLTGLLTEIAAIRSGVPAAAPTAPALKPALAKKPAGRKGDGAKARAQSPAAASAPLADPSMLALFRTEAEEQCRRLTDGLLALEDNPSAADRLEALMRAAHSIKGAARLVGVDAIVRLAHVMEDAFVAAQRGELTLRAESMDTLLRGVDTITGVAKLADEPLGQWGASHAEELETLLDAVGAILSGEPITLAEAKAAEVPAEHAPAPEPSAAAAKAAARPAERSTEGERPKAELETADKDRVLRVTAERWNHLMGLAGEVKVEAGWLHPYVGSMSQLKRRQIELVEILDSLRDIVDGSRVGGRTQELVLQALRKAGDCRKLLADRIGDLDSYDRRITNLSERLHRETIATRMRPFSDGVHGFQRMVRDIARSLGKKVKLEIYGLSTQVDRDVLEKMEAPLNHLLRNALDHGLESPEERVQAGKPEQGTIKLTAMHSDGMLSILVEDDGCGVNLERLRHKIVEKGHVTADMAERLTEEELLEFLYLPSFSTKEQVTDISGRGVGLDVVLDTIQKMRGSVRTTTKFGTGTCFHLQLPLTLSVMSTLLAEIAGEPYAFPLARIIRAVQVPTREVEVLEDHQYATIGGEHIGLVGAAQVFGLGGQLALGDELPVVIVGNEHDSYGVVVDRFIGQRELAIQALDSRLGKVQDISAAALLENGTPVLIVDVDDLVHSVDTLVKGGRVGKVRRESGDDAEHHVKRILVVDDSLTVREVERNLLEAAGYMVDVAVDGVDGWNAIRTARHYNMVITDIDMPRMDGIELVRMIKADRQFSRLPVVIVSYKDRAEDRRRGLDAGADYYLTKGSFHDNTLLQAVHDLIGEA